MDDLVGGPSRHDGTPEQQQQDNGEAPQEKACVIHT